ncbi:hypothetical protein [Microbulbifer sp. TYP-18]|uniref:hypothetical protein n=1 Tax=Microbulbifer sp. TYP-18 TaxID=3230024 RepID=UPI0034C6D3C0
MLSLSRYFLGSFSIFSILFYCQIPHASYYPSRGDLYYDGRFYMDSYFLWDTSGPWSVSDPGYEHDLNVRDKNFFTSTCITATNLPDGYDDCPTAGILDPNGPVFSFGSFDAKKINSGSVYFGAWQFSSHGSATTSPFILMGQENENRCFGIPTIWCMFSTQTKQLITGWNMNWGGYPTVLVWN